MEFVVELMFLWLNWVVGLLGIKEVLLGVCGEFLEKKNSKGAFDIYGCKVWKLLWNWCFFDGIMLLECLESRKGRFGSMDVIFKNFSKVYFG